MTSSPRPWVTAIATTLALVLLTAGSGGDAGARASTGDPPASRSTTEASATTEATQTGAPLPEALAGQLRAALDGVHDKLGYPGAIAGVWSPQGTWVGATGIAGEGDTRAPTSDDHTRIGSLTKTFTATLILQLMEDGMLSLDDPISDYVDDIPNSQATLRQVANMTSGIPSYTTQESFQNDVFGDPAQVFTPDQLLDYVRDLPPDFAPGEGWNYSNSNYVLLGLVVEEVTGRPIAEVMDERILQPLGLRETSFPGESADLPSPHLRGVTNQGQPEGQTADATDWNPSWGWTAGAMISTLEDLGVWGHALATGEGILEPATQTLRLESFLASPPPNTPEMGYGLGLGRAGGWIGHTGELPGFNTTTYYHAELETTVVVLANSDIAVDGANPAPATFSAISDVLTQ
jgi:D-alanyl-D-alanine carboxypeptidase